MHQEDVQAGKITELEVTAAYIYVDDGILDYQASVDVRICQNIRKHFEPFVACVDYSMSVCICLVLCS